MPALSSGYNETPDRASRAFDADRDGFVIAGGGGTVVVEEYEHAKAQGAKIYAEVAGYGATSDGYDMVQPSGEGAVRCMKLAMDTVDQPVDYINTWDQHAGRRRERARRHQGSVQGPQPNSSFNSTKSLTGHSLGAAGVHESIDSRLMLDNNVIGESANLEELEPAAIDKPVVRERMDNAEIKCVLSNSFGFGGTNASLVFKRVDA